MIGQHVADGLLTGAIIALGAIGVTLSMSILRFANFAHSEFITVGAYLALTGIAAFAGVQAAPIGAVSFGWPLIVAALAALVLTGVIAIVLDALVFRRLRRTGAPWLTLIFASFGASLVLRNLILMVYGASPDYYSRELQIAIRLLPGVRIMPDQIVVLGFTLVLVVLLWAFLRFTALGLSMRAVAESPVLARVSGIDVERVTRATWFLSGALAAMAGVFLGLTVQLRPEMGFNLLLPLFAATILGGVGSVIGAVVGGLLVGLAENLSVIVLSPGYKAAVPFLLLILVLLLRPTGLFGARR